MAVMGSGCGGGDPAAERPAADTPQADTEAGGGDCDVGSSREAAPAGAEGWRAGYTFDNAGDRIALADLQYA